MSNNNRNKNYIKILKINDMNNSAANINIKNYLAWKETIRIFQESIKNDKIKLKNNLARPNSYRLQLTHLRDSKNSQYTYVCACRCKYYSFIS